MADPMIVPFDLNNAGAMVKAMSTVADKTQRMAAGYAQALGPAQRLVQANMQLRNANLFGNTNQQFDAQFRAFQANRSLNRAQNQMQGNDLGRALKNLLMSTRVGVGGGFELMPLIGRTLMMLSESGPVGIALATAAVAIISFATATAKAAEAANDFARAFMSTGATGPEAARLSTLGGALGISNQQMGAMASSFARALASDPALAAIHGISNPLGNTPFGKLDQAQLLLQAMRLIRTLPADQAIRFARQYGLESMLGARNLSGATMVRLGRDAQTQSRVFNPQFLQQAQEFATATSRLGEALTNLLASVSGPMLQDMMKFFNGLADVLNQAAEWFAGHQGFVKLYYDFWHSLAGIMMDPLNPSSYTSAMRKLQEDTRNLTDPKKMGQEEHTRAVRENTDTLKEQIAAMKGVFGGGARARGAYPMAGGMQWNNPAIRESIQLGAFAL